MLALKQMEAAKQQSADAKVGAGISAADAPHRHEINVPKETIAVAVNQDISSATGQGKAQADGGAGEGMGATVAPELALKRQQVWLPPAAACWLCACLRALRALPQQRSRRVPVPAGWRERAAAVC